MIRGAAVVMLVAVLAACGASHRGDTTLTSDQELMAAVHDAAQLRVPPDQVEQRVGRRAAVNTHRGADDWMILRGASIYATDPPTGEPLDFEGARDVAYWGRDIPAHNAPIVGLIWKADGPVEPFTAFVLPP